MCKYLKLCVTDDFDCMPYPQGKIRRYSLESIAICSAFLIFSCCTGKRRALMFIMVQTQGDNIMWPIVYSTDGSHG